MADLRSSQVTTQVEWSEAPLLKTDQFTVQVEYYRPGEGEYYGQVDLAVIPESDCSSHFEYAGDIPVSVIPESETGDKATYTGHPLITLVPESASGIEWNYAGGITVALEPESDILGDYGYSGLSIVRLFPESVASIPKVGFDWWYGYGLVDLTFLGGNPPYYCVSGDIQTTATLDGTVLPFRRHTVSGSGGLRLGGSGIQVFSKPEPLVVIGSGGLNISGEGTVLFPLPDIYSYTGEGGLKVSGEGVVDFIGIDDIPKYIVTGSGGIELDGEGTSLFIGVDDPYVVIGSGGLSIAGRGITNLLDITDIAYTVIGSGGLIASGTGYVKFIDVSKIYGYVASGGLNVSASGRIAFFAPAIFSVTGNGGIVTSGTGLHEDFVYQTWVLTGKNKHASIYSNYNFNSYCKYNGVYYAASNDGISKLGGLKDGINTIHTGLRIGPTNFGTFNRKKLRAIYVGTPNGQVDTQITGITGDHTITKDFKATQGKAKISRDIIGENLTIDISDFNELSLLDIKPVVSGKRRHG